MAQQLQSDPIINQRQYVNVKKNYIDPLAAFQRLQGSNLVHLAMALGIIFVDFGDSASQEVLSEFAQYDQYRYNISKTLGVVDTISGTDL